MNKRIEYIDIAKCIAILGIVCVHLPNGSIINICETFHVVTFFIISGILNARKNIEDSFIAYAKKRSKVLLWPYLMLSICNLVVSVILALKNQEINILLNDFFKTILLRGIGTLWFFPVLLGGELICRLIYGYWVKRYKVFLLWLLINVVTILFIQCNNHIHCSSFLDFNEVLMWPIEFLATIVIASSFILLGYLMAPILYGLIDYSKRNSIVCIILFIVFTVLDIIAYPKYNCDLHYLRFDSYIVYLFCSICGSISIILLSILLSYSRILIKYLTFLGSNSMIIMCTHKDFFIVYILSLICTKIGLYNIVNSIVTLLLTVIVEIFLIKMINNTRLKYLFRIPIEIKTK